MYAGDSILPPSWQRRSNKDAEVFEKLLRAVRDRYLNSEIKQISSIIKLLKSGDILENLAEVDRCFNALTAEKEKYRKEQELETLRVIRNIQIHRGMIDAAIEALEEIIEEHIKTMTESPFSKYSVFDWMKPEDGMDDSRSTEEEYTEEERASSEAGSASIEGDSD
jgi:hypothetical protein